MSREQTLFAAASAFQDLADVPDLIRGGALEDYSREYIECLLLAEADLLATRKAYEGVAFETETEGIKL